MVSATGIQTAVFYLRWGGPPTAAGIVAGIVAPVGRRHWRSQCHPMRRGASGVGAISQSDCGLPSRRNSAILSLHGIEPLQPREPSHAAQELGIWQPSFFRNCTIDNALRRDSSHRISVSGRSGAVGGGRAGGGLPRRSDRGLGGQLLRPRAASRAARTGPAHGRRGPVCPSFWPWSCDLSMVPWSKREECTIFYPFIWPRWRSRCRCPWAA